MDDDPASGKRESVYHLETLRGAWLAPRSFTSDLIEGGEEEVQSSYRLWKVFSAWARAVPARPFAALPRSIEVDRFMRSLAAPPSRISPQQKTE